MIDLLSSEYGWSKSAILEETYLDEALILVRLIRKRKNSEYQIQLLIAHNPNSEKPEELWEMLRGDEDKTEEIQTEMDRKGMELLKAKMSGNPRLIVK